MSLSTILMSANFPRHLIEYLSRTCHVLKYEFISKPNKQHSKLVLSNKAASSTKYCQPVISFA